MAPGKWVEILIEYNKFYGRQPQDRAPCGTSNKRANMVAPSALVFQAAGRRLLRPLQSKMPSQSGSSVSQIREAHRIRMSFSACEPFACSLFQRVVPGQRCHLRGKNSYKHPENCLDAADVFKWSALCKSFSSCVQIYMAHVNTSLRTWRPAQRRLPIRCQAQRGDRPSPAVHVG